MAPDDSDDDRKVKEMLAEGTPPLDPATQADLERWFGMPSAMQLEEEGKQPGFADEEMQAAIDRREKALANIDPAFVRILLDRTEDRPSPIKATPDPIDVIVDENLALFDQGMVDRALQLAEPREIEISDELRDDLKECTPQALLRDLHRAESYFDKQFELVDVAAEQRFDIVAEVKSAMRTSWKLPSFPKKPVEESRDDINAARSTRREPWTSFLPFLPNRTVRE
jgi:hypothetical protein